MNYPPSMARPPLLFPLPGWGPGRLSHSSSHDRNKTPRYILKWTLNKD